MDLSHRGNPDESQDRRRCREDPRRYVPIYQAAIAETAKKKMRFTR
jgi:hypothetical protein